MIRHKFIRSTSCDPFGKWWNELGQGVILGCIFFEGPNPYTYLLFFTFCSWAPAFYYVFLGAAPYPVAPHGFHPGLSAFAMLFA